MRSRSTVDMLDMQEVGGSNPSPPTTLPSPVQSVNPPSRLHPECKPARLFPRPVTRKRSKCP